MGIQLTLPEQEVHVWYTPATGELDTHVVARYLPLLAPIERKRHARFVQEKDRRQYLLGKVLVRKVLSLYVEREPEEWIFATNNLGKPVLANGPADSHIHFNLSHTDGLVVCAVAHNIEVGIDVENITRKVNLDLAQRYSRLRRWPTWIRCPSSDSIQSFFCSGRSKRLTSRRAAWALPCRWISLPFAWKTCKRLRSLLNRPCGRTQAIGAFIYPRYRRRTTRSALAVRSGNELTVKVTALTL